MGESGHSLVSRKFRDGSPVNRLGIRFGARALLETARSHTLCAVVLFGVVLLSTSGLFADLNENTGAFIIDTTCPTVNVAGNASLTLQTGADINTLNALENATIVLENGQIDNYFAEDNTHTTFQSGDIFNLIIQGFAQAEFNGDASTDPLYVPIIDVNGNANLDIRSGTFDSIYVLGMGTLNALASTNNTATFVGEVVGFDEGTVNVYSGEILRVEANGSSTFSFTNDNNDAPPVGMAIFLDDTTFNSDGWGHVSVEMRDQSNASILSTGTNIINTLDASGNSHTDLFGGNIPEINVSGEAMVHIEEATTEPVIVGTFTAGDSTNSIFNKGTIQEVILSGSSTLDICLTCTNIVQADSFTAQDQSQVQAGDFTTGQMFLHDDAQIVVTQADGLTVSDSVEMGAGSPTFTLEFGASAHIANSLDLGENGTVDVGPGASLVIGDQATPTLDDTVVMGTNAVVWGSGNVLGHVRNDSGALRPGSAAGGQS